MGHPTDTQIMNKLIEIGDILESKLNELESSITYQDLKTLNTTTTTELSTTSTTTETITQDQNIKVKHILESNYHL